MLELEPEIQIALASSANESRVRTEEEQKHEEILQNLLQVNNLISLETERDGNCFFSSVFMLMNHENLRNILSPQHLREKVLEHILNEYELYSSFNTCFDFDTWKESSFWNSELGDLMPFATANFIKQPIQVFSSLNARSIYLFNPVHQYNSCETIRLAHNAAHGFEHYSPCVSTSCCATLQVSADASIIELPCTGEKPLDKPEDASCVTMFDVPLDIIG